MFIVLRHCLLSFDLIRLNAVLTNSRKPKLSRKIEFEYNTSYLVKTPFVLNFIYF